ncbi:MAG: hypothetical protein ACUZ8E_05255 [Candidatus Anammoxibacter sp.]
MKLLKRFIKCKSKLPKYLFIISALVSVVSGGFFLYDRFTDGKNNELSVLTIKK